MRVKGVIGMSAVVAALAAISGSAALAGPTPPERISVYEGPNGTEITAVSNPDSNGTRYIAGNFTAIDALDVGGAPVVNASTGKVDRSFPNVTNDWNSGEVYDAVPDGSGGYIISGTFTKVGGLDRKYLARINADGSVNDWVPPSLPTYSYPQAIAISGNTLYIGGSFTSVNSQPRNRVAAIDLTTGDLTSWAPNFNSTVFGFAVSGSKVYAVGSFTAVNSISRNRCAAVGTDGTLASWNPGCDGTTYSVAVDGATVYLGGYFTNAGGQPRMNLAAVDATTGTATSWNPGVDMNGVFAIEPVGSTVYIGGGFGKVGGQNRRCLAAVGTDGTVKPWDPGIAGCSNIYKLLVEGTSVYVAGVNIQLNATDYQTGLKLDSTTGALDTNFAPLTDGGSQTLVKLGDNILLGGSTRLAEGYRRNGLAAIDRNGQVTSWNPGRFGGQVEAIRVSGDDVFLGGSFTKVGGQDRSRLAAVGTDGTLRSWNPSANQVVNAIAIKDSTVYVGGSFSQVGGSERFGAAAISTGGVLQPWNPSVLSAKALPERDGTCGGEYNYDTYTYDPTYPCVLPAEPAVPADVYALAISGDTVYIGGNIVAVGDTDRDNVAAVGTDGSLKAFNPRPNAQVDAIATLGSKVYLGGPFGRVADSVREHLAVVGTDGTLDSSTPAVNGPVQAIAIGSSRIMIGGSFDNVGGNARQRVAALATDGTVLTSWDAQIATLDAVRVNAIDVSPTSTAIGGYLGKIGTKRLGGFAFLNTSDGALFTPDLTPPAAPAVTRTSPASTPTTATTATITYSGEDGATFTCSLDGAAFAPCSASPVSLSGLGIGAHRFEVKATDAAGNVSSAGAATWTVAAPPVAAPTVLTPASGAKTVYKTTVGGKSTWGIKAGLLFSTGGDTRGAAQLLTVQVAVNAQGQPVSTKPSDSQAPPTVASYSNGVNTWSSSGEVFRTSVAQPVWVRVGNRIGKWSNWVRLTP